MKNLTLRIFLTALLLACTAGISFAQQNNTTTTDVPQTISYQGLMTSSDGTVLPNGVYDITVTLYTNEAGTDAIWEQTYQTSVVNGVFNLYLGSGNAPLPGPQQMNRPLWVGTSVNGTDIMRPLTPLTSSPYALNLPDNAITTNKLADDAVTAEKVDMPYVAGLRINGQDLSSKGAMLNIQSGKDIDIRYDEVSESVVIESKSATGTVDGEKGADVLDASPATDNWIGRDPATFPLQAFYPTIGGTTSYNTVVSGASNAIADNADYSTIVGGNTNTIGDGSDADFIGGGAENSIADESNYNGIVGGESNAIGGESNHNCIGCGLMNSVGDDSHLNFIGGGETNSVADASDYNVIGGGNTNTVNAGNANTIGGGATNVTGTAASVTNYATVSGGQTNSATATHSTVGGGFTNRATATNATVGGGGINTASGTYATVGGGQDNVASGSHGTVSGGQDNVNSGPHGTIGGGVVNIVAAPMATVGGGANNTITAAAPEATIAGGHVNTIEAYVATIGGGHDNRIWPASDAGFIGGGRDNWITEGNPISTIGGGEGHRISAPEATIGGGHFNTVDAYVGAITGGHNNTVTTNGDAGFIGGGRTNTVDGPTAAIGGGESNTINPGSDWSFIGAGANNTITGPMATIGGGEGHTITAPEATIAGGHINTVDAYVGAITGGHNNHITVTGPQGTIGGGVFNVVAAAYGTVGGGQENTVSGSHATIPGGDLLTTTVSYAQSAMGFMNAPRGAVGVRPAPGALTDDPLFMVGNGDYAGGAIVRSNAFEVSYNGHSVVYDVNGSGGAGAPPFRPAIKGATYTDNVIYGWAEVDMFGNLICDDFGVASIVHMGPGWYQITLNITDPDGITPRTISCGAAVATVGTGFDPGVPPTDECYHIRTSNIVNNTFDVIINQTLGNECHLVDQPFKFHVTGRIDP